MCQLVLHISFRVYDNAVPYVPRVWWNSSVLYDFRLQSDTGNYLKVTVMVKLFLFTPLKHMWDWRYSSRQF